MFTLVNGDGNKTVTAQQDADLFSGIFGNTPIVLQVGEECRAEIRNSNTVRVYDGEMISQGRRFNQAFGDYADFTIENGTQNETRYDIIGLRFYSDSDGNELCEQFVQKNVGETGTIEEDAIRDGAVECYISMYRVKIVGLAIDSVVPMFSKIYSFDEVAQEIEKIKSETEKKLTDLLEKISGYALKSHNHDSRYYTEDEVNKLLNKKSNDGHGHREVTDKDGGHRFRWHWTGSAIEFWVDETLIRRW